MVVWGGMGHETPRLLVVVVLRGGRAVDMRSFLEGVLLGWASFLLCSLGGFESSERFWLFGAILGHSDSSERF